MSLSFPRAFPAIPFKQSSVTLQRRQWSGESEGDDDVVIDRGEPKWFGIWTTDDLTDAQAKYLDAWLASLRGGINTFLGYDTERAWPQAYLPQGAGMPGSGSGTLSSIGGARDAFGLAGLGAGLVLKNGDHLSLDLSGRKSLHMVLDASVTLNGSGAGTVTVDPPAPDWIDTTAIPTVVSPSAKFRLITPRDAVTFDGDGGPRPGKPLTIKAISTPR
jgi:hypothetical protein